GRLHEACGFSQPDYYDCHFYGKGFADLPQNPFFGTIAEGLSTAMMFTGGVPVTFSEGGVKLGEIGGEGDAAAGTGRAGYVSRWVSLVRQHSSIVPFGTFFALYDEVGAPSERGDQAFGLIAERDPATGTQRRRPAYDAFRQALGA